VQACVRQSTPSFLRSLDLQAKAIWIGDIDGSVLVMDHLHGRRWRTLRLQETAQASPAKPAENGSKTGKTERGSTELRRTCHEAIAAAFFLGSLQEKR